MKDRKFCDDLIIEGKSPPKKLIRTIVFLFVIALCVVLFTVIKPKLPVGKAAESESGLNSSDYTDSDSFNYTDSENTTDSEDTTDSPDIQNRDTSLLYYYNQMSEKNQKLYLTLCDMFEAKEFELRDGLSGYTKDDVRAVASGVFFDHPEWCWYNDSYTSSSNSSTGEVMSLSFTSEYGLLCDKSEMAKIEQEVENAANDIINDVSQLSSDYEKALAVHDRLVADIDYNTDLAERRTSGTETKKDSLQCSIYGALTSGSTVCQGYAQAFQYIMNKLGIECIYVIGDADGQSHAWNIVKLDGDYYQVDVTWDDPINTGTYSVDSSFIGHKYFCITTSDISADHTVDTGLFDVPDCTATSCNYYVRSDLYFDNYDSASVTNCIKQAIANGADSIEMMFAPGEYAKAKSELIDNNKINSLLAESNSGNGYLYRDTSPVLVIFF